VEKVDFHNAYPFMSVESGTGNDDSWLYGASLGDGSSALDQYSPVAQNRLVKIDQGAIQELLYIEVWLLATRLVISRLSLVFRTVYEYF